MSDANCGDFAVQHWCRSLVANVNLQDVDVIFLDYGLTPSQRKQLEAQGVECRTCVKEGWIGTMLWRDMAAFLSERSYDQVLTTDAGDLIFQSDVRHLFDQDKDAFRGVCEELEYVACFFERQTCDQHGCRVSASRKVHPALGNVSKMVPSLRSLRFGPIPCELHYLSRPICAARSEIQLRFHFNESTLSYSRRYFCGSK